MSRVMIELTGKRLGWGAAITTIMLAVLTVSWAGWGASTDETKLLIDKGREVFLTVAGIGCAACHGPYAEGDTGIGPYNRGFGEAKIRAALASVEAMKLVREQLSDEQIKEVAAYYEWLGQLKLVKTLIKRGRFAPDHVELYPGTRIQLVLNNAGSSPLRFSSETMGIGAITVGARAAADLVWEAPAKDGTFTLACSDCESENQKLTIEVTEKAPKFIPATVESRSGAKD